MSFPVGVDVVTLTAGDAGLRSFDGSPYQGTLRLTPSVPRVVSTEHGVIALGVVNITVGASGQFTENPAVLANDAEGFTPSGWTYRVDEEFTNAPGRAYSILLPAAVPVVALPSLVEVDASDGTVVLTPVSGPAGGDLSGSYPDPAVARLNGVAVSGTPAVGQVPTATSTSSATWQTPSGGGGGSGTPADTVTGETSYGQSSGAGSAGTYSRGDHTHGSPALSSTAASNSTVGAAAAAGSASTPARGDHVHGRESFGTVTAQTSFAAASANGSASSVARSDHAHGTPSLPSASTSVSGAVQLDGTAADIQALGAQAAGSVGKAADAGHVHPTSGMALSTDPRFTDSRAPSGAASGDLSGTFPGPTVAKLNGVTVSGVAASGKVLTASSASAADWQTPSAGGGGSSIRTASVRVTDDSLAGLAGAASWALIQTSVGTTLQCQIAASAGDRVRVVGRFMRKGSHFLDWVLLDSVGAIALYATTGTGSAPSEGDPALYPSLSFGYEGGEVMFTVGSGHIDGSGKITVALAHQGSDGGGANVVYAHSTYPFRMRLENIGPEPA